MRRQFYCWMIRWGKWTRRNIIIHGTVGVKMVSSVAINITFLFQRWWHISSSALYSDLSSLCRLSAINGEYSLYSALISIIFYLNQLLIFYISILRIEKVQFILINRHAFQQLVHPYSFLRIHVCQYLYSLSYSLVQYAFYHLFHTFKVNGIITITWIGICIHQTYILFEIDQLQCHHSY